MLLLFLLPLVAAGTPDRRIVGGGNVTIADFPWQGSFRTVTGSHNCGCIYIGGRWAVSAAHCGGGTNYVVVFGNSDRTAGEVFNIAQHTNHPQYGQGPGFSPNDISVMQTTAEISGSNIEPGILVTSAENPEPARAWITGWGRLCGGCELPIALQGTEINVISDDLCEQQWPENFQRSNMICVWDGPSGTVGACNGDSGGPMSIGNVIYGVTSWIRTGCISTSPSVYVRVGAFTPWVCSEVEGVDQC